MKNFKPGFEMSEPLSELHFWEVENTGWSGGISWFPVMKNNYENRRFDSEQSAIDHATKNKLEMNDRNTLWRSVAVTIATFDSGVITVRKWNPI